MGILERCLVDLALRPMFDGTFITIIPGRPSNDAPFRLTTSRHLAVAIQVPYNESQAIHPIQDFSIRTIAIE